MLVKKIEELTKNRVKVICECDFSFVLYKGEVRLYGIKENSEIEETSFRTIMEEVLPKRAKLRAMNLLKVRPYTVKGLTDKLQDNGYPQKIIAIAIEYVSSYHYLDDKQYASDYINTYKDRKNKLKLTTDLLNKGVSKEIISEVLCEEFDDDFEDYEVEQIKSFIRKKGYDFSDISNIPYETRNKLLAALYRKGYSVSLSKKILSLSDEFW